MIDYRVPSLTEFPEAQARSLAAADAVVAALVAVPDAGRTYANTLLPLEDISDLLEQASGRFGFMSYVAEDAEVRAAAEQMREALDKYAIDLGFREDVHAAVMAFAATAEAQVLSGEAARLLAHTLRDYRRNGFDLPAEQRARTRSLKNRLVELDIAFQRNIDTWDDAIMVTREELAGLPESYIERLRTEERDGDRLYRVSLDYPEYFPFMDNAESEELRRELLIKQQRQGGEQNIALLEEAIAVRDELATLLGYPSWAAYVLEVKMAKTPEQAHQFLDDLRAKVEPRLRRDLSDMTEEKRKHTGRADATVELWDWRYYDTHLRRQRFAVDPFAVSKYFPLNVTLDMMFHVYQTLFGVRFEPVEPANAWHPDVRLFRVRDATTEEEIAHFFMDLFPRKDKYGHAAAWTLRPGRRLADGSYQRPISAIVANFTKPTAQEPSLLLHIEVQTLFHEFGHVLHQTLTRAEQPRFSGSNTERDFVEAPSQMLEHWTWLPEVLARFSRHVDTGEPLPDDLLAAMVAAKHLNSGITTARQLYFAALDLACHGPGAHKDTTAIARDLYPISGFAMPEETYWQAGFGHLFGYDAGYYGYLWSQVYADDMYTRFESAGPLDPAIGLTYRRTVLERGGSVDGDVLVRDFLGREPNNEAFLRDLGL
jgi:thimet oligopeptidase